MLANNTADFCGLIMLSVLAPFKTQLSMHHHCTVASLSIWFYQNVFLACAEFLR
jgi:hypothetical protein